jgi:hypothetical protein
MESLFFFWGRFFSNSMYLVALVALKYFIIEETNGYFSFFNVILFCFRAALKAMEET